MKTETSLPNVRYEESSRRNPEDIASYDVVHCDEGYVFKLLRSNDSGWTPQCRGELLVAVEDTGNGIVLDMETHKKIKLDYSQVVEVYIALHHYLRSSTFADKQPGGKLTLKSFVEEIE